MIGTGRLVRSHFCFLRRRRPLYETGTENAALFAVRTTRVRFDLGGHMKSCTIVFAVVLVLSTSPAWSQGFRGSAGVARSGGSWGHTGGGRIGVTSGSN